VRDKKKGIFGYKRFLFPLIKLVCSSFMSSSVLHKIAVREEVVPVPFRHTCPYRQELDIDDHADPIVT
jgi:hypothetical protein